MKQLLSLLGAFSLLMSQAQAANPIGGTFLSGSGGTAPCAGTTYEALGTSGASPTFTLGTGGACTYYLDSGAGTDTFATVTIALPTVHTDGVTEFNIITTRAITTLQFTSADGTPIYVNGTTATSLSNVAANAEVAIVYIESAIHPQLDGILQ